MGGGGERRGEKTRENRRSKIYEKKREIKSAQDDLATIMKIRCPGVTHSEKRKRIRNRRERRRKSKRRKRRRIRKVTPLRFYTEKTDLSINEEKFG